MEGCRVLDGGLAANHNLGSYGTSHREFFERTAPALPQRFFNGFPHGFDRVFGVPFLIRRNTSVSGNTLPA